VDHPLATAGDVAALLDAFARRPPGKLIVLPSVAGRRGHPALFAAELLPEFLALGDDEPAHGIARRDPARVLLVPRENAWLVRDIDTPEDLAAARAALEARGGTGEPGAR
jgi:CTP:molybdopterin cytidylyltransferase MocA